MKRRYTPIKHAVGILAIFLPLVTSATLTGSLDEEAIAKRLEPAAKVNIEFGSQAMPTHNTAELGKKRYSYTCKMCHEAGIAGAPKLSDKTAWQPRLSAGMEALIKHAIEGYKAMPPKGGCLTCDDEEIKKTVEYMISQVK